MKAIAEVLLAMNDILLMADEVDRVGRVLSEMSRELRNQDNRLVRLETFVEVGKMGRPSKH